MISTRSMRWSNVYVAPLNSLSLCLIFGRCWSCFLHGDRWWSYGTSLRLVDCSCLSWDGGELKADDFIQSGPRAGHGSAWRYEEKPLNRDHNWVNLPWVRSHLFRFPDHNPQHRTSPPRTASSWRAEDATPSLFAAGFFAIRFDDLEQIATVSCVVSSPWLSRREWWGWGVDEIWLGLIWASFLKRNMNLFEPKSLTFVME